MGMDASLKWIGGGTLALGLGLGALAFGSTLMDSPAIAEETAPVVAAPAPVPGKYHPPSSHLSSITDTIRMGTAFYNPVGDAKN